MCRKECDRADPSSFVELTSSHALSKHIDIVWDIRFVESTISGYVEITCISQSLGECNITLDTRSLNIKHVSLIHDTHVYPANYAIDVAGHHETLGTPIRVCLSENASEGQEFVVRVEYSTTIESSALQWLTPEQTSSKKHPFVFSQCQAIHARSLLPCQDICAAKVTYSAKVRYPSKLTALMSAVRMGAATPDPSDPSYSIAIFNQNVPIPPYLIAIACGELESCKLGPRSVVWAEPSVVEKAAHEFEDVEAIIQAGEKLCGPYRFGIYDLLVLPPSFPYGGMENPCLTFVTPTLLAGDKSQVAVIAHELAHSWSGNLVTNSTWEHFWLNEGLTVFTEGKIVESFFGKESADLRAQEGWDHLVQYVAEVGEGHNYTKLSPDTQWGEDPDDSFSVVPYEKGAAFFCYLQSLVGRDVFEKFIIRFFDAFAFKTVDSESFKKYFVESFPGATVDWSKWFKAPGMPQFKPHVDPTAVAEALALADEWIRSPNRTASASEITSWPSAKKCVFVNALLANVKSLNLAGIESMIENYKFLDTNCEVRCAFITLMLRLVPCSPIAQTAAVQLATEQGRMKYTRPMYKELAKANKALAAETFIKHRHSYHPICAKMVARDLGL